MNNDDPVVRVLSNDLDAMLRMHVIQRLPFHQRVEALRQWQTEQKKERPQ